MKYIRHVIFFATLSVFAIPLTAYATLAPAPSLAELAAAFLQYFAILLLFIFFLLLLRIIVRRNDPTKKVRRTGIIVTIVVFLGAFLVYGGSLWLNTLPTSYDESLPKYQELTLADLVNNPEAFFKQTTWVRLNGVIEKRTPDRCTKLQGATSDDKLEKTYQLYPSEWVVTDGTNEVGITFYNPSEISRSVRDESIPKGEIVNIQGIIGYRAVTVDCVDNVFYPALMISMDVLDFTNPRERPLVF